jgi:hypothetical protein
MKKLERFKRGTKLTGKAVSTEASQGFIPT